MPDILDVHGMEMQCCRVRMKGALMLFGQGEGRTPLGKSVAEAGAHSTEGSMSSLLVDVRDLVAGN